MAEAAIKYSSDPPSRNQRSPSWFLRPHEWTPKLGLWSPVTRVLFHPTLSVVVAASEDGCVRQWDVETREHWGPIRIHADAVLDLAFDPTGRFLASCSADESVRLWLWRSGKLDLVRFFCGHFDKVTSVCFAPSGEHLVTSSRDKTVKLWKAATGECLWTFQGHSDWVRMVRVNDDGTLLASCSDDKTVVVWAMDSKERKAVIRGHESIVECVAWAPTNAQPRRASADGDLRSGTCAGPLLAICSQEETVKVWDVGAGVALFTLAGHDDWVRRVIFHPNGRHLLSASEDKTIRAWDLDTQRCVTTLEATSLFCSSIDVHRTAPYLATGSVCMMVDVWQCI